MKLKTPIIIINFKTYESATGKNAVKLAKMCEAVAKKEKANIAVAVQAADIFRVSEAVKIPVLAQHIDGFEYGGHTGSVLAETVKQNGAIGTLLNHSEKRIDVETIKKAVAKARANNLDMVICSPDPNMAKELAMLGPDFVAVEPPELIGGNISVSTAKPEVISDSVKLVSGSNPNVRLIVGAGIKNAEDVRTAVRLGAKGVLLASGVTQAEDPKKVLMDLVKGLKEK